MTRAKDISKIVSDANFGGTLDVAGNVTVTGDIRKTTSGTSNFAAGVNAGNSIESGGNYNTVVGDEAGTAITTGDRNVAIGYAALDAVTTASYNTAIGYNSATANTSGASNVSVGDNTFSANLSGDNNTTIGQGSLRKNTTGDNNVAVGLNALGANTTASNNTAVGTSSLITTTTGHSNTSLGRQSMYWNTTGYNNTAVGMDAQQSNTNGHSNVSIGVNALFANIGGHSNTAVGTSALDANTTGSGNTAIGLGAGGAITTGTSNTFLGKDSGKSQTTSNGSTFIGQDAGYHITTGAKSTIIGAYNGNQGGLDIRTSNNNIVLSDGDGNPRVQISGVGGMNVKPSSGDVIIATSTHGANNSNSIFVGVNSSAVVFNVTTNGNVTNTNNSYGALSDVKLKENIIDASSQWNDIKALTVRKYSMKTDNLDAPNMLGVVAQEVEAVGMGGLITESPDKNPDGTVLETTTKSVNYSILYMKAVKALQEAMTRIETLEAKVATLEG